MTKENLSIYEIDTIKGFEKVIIFANQSPAVEGIVAIHSTLRGPALGGCRLYNYPNFQSGFKDALRLSAAMTYKNAIMDLPFGGGKTVIFQNNSSSRNEIFEVLAKLLNKLNGQYLTTDDVGTSVQDMYYMRKFTQYAKGVYCNEKQIPATSYGVCQAIKATFKHYKHLTNLKGVKVIVQGLGNVGYNLCQYLHQEGCKLYVNDHLEDLVNRAVKEFAAVPINFNEIDNIEADVFCPCALGGTVNEEILSKLQIKYIIGGENNQLASPEIENILKKKGIIYLPDYLCNAGGVIDIACESNDYNEKTVLARVATIYHKTLEILRLAQLSNKSPLEISNRLVQDQLKSLRQSRFETISSDLEISNQYKRDPSNLVSQYEINTA